MMTTMAATGDMDSGMKDCRYGDYFRARKRACKTKAVRGTIILKKNGGGEQKGFRFSDYCRGRKSAHKSKPKPVNDAANLRFILRKRNREYSQDLKLDSGLLRFESVTMAAADCAEKRRRIGESIMRRCKSAGAIRGCGRVDEYVKLSGINRGAYGAVYMARDRRSGEIVAVKEEFEGVSIPTLREIDILSSLPPHPSIVGFKGAVSDDSGDVYVVMEHVDHDLRRYMEVVPGLDEREIKKLMKQLLEGVQFLHANNVMHRDLKPANILVTRWGELKICDFGMSRRLEAAGRYSPEVGTPWYRAPEMLRGETAYSTAVDMWAVGCVMAEMMTNRALFKGPVTDCGQLETIDGIVGGNGNHDELRKTICCEGFSDAGFHLLTSLLSCDPTHRITAQSANNHLWFHDL